MRTILNISIAGMVAAGIYGFADFTNDLRTGNMIRYNDSEKAEVKKTELAPRKVLTGKLYQKKTVTDVKAKLLAKTEETILKKEKEKTPVLDTKKLDLKYFSRGRPYIVEEELTDEPDSTASDTASEAKVEAIKPQATPQ